MGVVFRLFESKGWLDAGGSFSPASMSFRRLRARFLHNRHCQSDAFAGGVVGQPMRRLAKTVANCLRLGSEPDVLITEGHPAFAWCGA